MRKVIDLVVSLMIACCSLMAYAGSERLVKVYGRVSSEGVGVANVAVTDGERIVLTDKQGYYSMMCDSGVKFVYISMPNGYDVYIKNGVPCFYHSLPSDKTKNKFRFDFDLKRGDKDNSQHILVVWADPQVYFDDEISEVIDAAEDVKALLADKYPNVPAIGVCCGDIVGDISRRPLLFEPVNDAMRMSGVPFYFVKGNHDMDVNVRTNDLSSDTFNRLYGPSYYSFDFGKIHYVILDDVFFIGKSTSYIGYLSEKQLVWLENDLSRIATGSSVVVCLHIPTYSREARHQEWSKESLNKVLNNRRALYNILKPYNAHIMSGHEHYNENYILSDSIYEHVHAPLSNLFWCAPWACDGTPGGYAVYEMDSVVSNWYYKGIGMSIGEQFSLYKSGLLKTDNEAIVVNVWNYDSTWKVEWFENDEYKGHMVRYTGYDPNISNYVKENSSNFKHKYIGAGPTEHLFYALPDSDRSVIKIKVTDHNGNVFIKEVENVKP